MASVACNYFLVIFTVALSLLIAYSAIQLSQLPPGYLSVSPLPFQSEPAPDFTPFIKENLFSNSVVHSGMHFPEDIAVDSHKNIYTGLINGTILKIDTNGSQIPIFTLRDHSIMGLVLTKDESALYFISPNKGVYKLNLSSLTSSLLFDTYNNTQLIALNQLALNTHENKLYVTQASTALKIQYSNKELLLKHPRGRVLAYDLNTKILSILADKLHYPNGIVYEESTNSVIVAELAHYKILRIHTRTGTIATVAANLIGYPDNLRLNSQGDLLVGIPAFRDKVTDLIDKYPLLRRIVTLLPEKIIYLFVQKTYAGGIKINLENGEIKDYIIGPASIINFVTTIIQKHGNYYFSSLVNPSIVVVGVNQSQHKTEEL